MAQILIVDDEEKIRILLEMMLSEAGHQVFQAENGLAALEQLEKIPIDLVVSDVCMDGMDGFALLEQIRQRELGCPVVFVTAFANLESAVDALRLGAADYLVKPFQEEDVILAVERALGRRRLLAENQRLRQQVHEKGEGEAGVFVSPRMLQVRHLADKVAASDATVLLTGESGTGKEVVANYIHKASKRCKGRFVAMNCAAIPSDLLETELFGHEKGAFTGADRERPGKFEYAAGGTLFLDEIGELPLEAQAKLLRTIQEKRVQRLGGNRELETNCRLICATNRDLGTGVQKGTFREDLYYRLAVFPIDLPPLRERVEDILPLVRYSMEKFGARVPDKELVTPAAKALLESYRWPGNVRELFNAVERALIMRTGNGPFTSDDFPYLERPGEKLQVVQSDPFVLPPDGIDFEELQLNIVRQSLERTMGNQSAAARLLGLSRAKFRTLLGQLGGEEPSSRIVIQFHRGRQG
ncbi:MAG: sigma-54-dependent Fis family transcriptional regulator [Desulfuromonadaceae bacterium]|nr:sigma-54-dependent Fis family transcriptional regulator [Desulfuromonadaceae bacterium]